MRLMKFVVPILTAVIVLSAVAASTATAQEKTKILPEGTEASPVTFLLDQESAGKINLKGGSDVECKSAHGLGSAVSANGGPIEILFRECTSILSTVCTSTDAETGTIKFTGKFHFWLALREAKLVGAIVLLFGQLTARCKVSLINERFTMEPGCFAGEVGEGELNKLVETFYVLYHQSSGVPAIAEVLPAEATGEIKCLAEAKIGAGSLEESALEAHFKFDEFERGETATTILLMNPEGL